MEIETLKEQAYSVLGVVEGEGSVLTPSLLSIIVYIPSRCHSFSYSNYNGTAGTVPSHSFSVPLRARTE